MKTKEIMKNTSNLGLYNKARKMYLSNQGLISCSICPYNKRENANKRDYRSWKYHRRTQYKWK